MLSNNLIYKSYYNLWKNINKTVFVLIVILFGLGLFFSLVSTSLIASDKLNTNSYYFFLKHLFFIFLGVFFIIFFSSLKQDDLTKVSTLFFFLFLFFLLLVPFFGVEVKGTRNAGSKVIVTEGEVRKAEEAKVELFVVSMIKIKYHLEKKNIVCSSGQWVVISPWKPLTESLKPKTYDYELPTVEWNEI